MDLGEWLTLAVAVGTWGLVIVTWLLARSTKDLAKTTARQVEESSRMLRLNAITALADENLIKRKTAVYRRVLGKRLQEYLEAEWASDRPAERAPKDDPPESKFTAFD